MSESKTWPGLEKNNVGLEVAAGPCPPGKQISNVFDIYFKIYNTPTYIYAGSWGIYYKWNIQPQLLSASFLSCISFSDSVQNILEYLEINPAWYWILSLVLNICTRYCIFVPDIKYLYQILYICARYWIFVPDIEYFYQILYICARCWISGTNNEYLCQI